jgi:hypothetical protein
MVCSTSSSNNIHEFVNDNSNPYRSMMMDTMRMNQGYSGEGSFNIFLDEKSNIDATKFFELLKDYDESLWDWCKIHNKLSVISQNSQSLFNNLISIIHIYDINIICDFKI